MGNYNLNRMSNKSIVVFERGRFFIQTGSARSFYIFHNDAGGIIRYMPRAILKRIEDLINRGDRDSATTLWLKACESADLAPLRIKHNLIHWGIHILIGGIALYAFIKVL
jgi:hypothetical protein